MQHAAVTGQLVNSLLIFDFLARFCVGGQSWAEFRMFVQKRYFRALPESGDRLRAES